MVKKKCRNVPEEGMQGPFCPVGDRSQGRCRGASLRSDRWRKGNETRECWKQEIVLPESERAYRISLFSRRLQKEWKSPFLPRLPNSVSLIPLTFVDHRSLYLCLSQLPHTAVVECRKGLADNGSLICSISNFEKKITTTQKLQNKAQQNKKQ